MIDVDIKSSKGNKRSDRDPIVRWSNITKENAIKLSEKVKIEESRLRIS